VNLISLLLINFFISFVLTKFIIFPFKKIIPDSPNKRSAHKEIKPRGGGLVFIFINFINSSLFRESNFIFLLPLSILSLIDDIKDINQWIRFFMQIFTSTYIVLSSNFYIALDSNMNLILKVLLIILLVFISTAFINFCNFVDGLDGLLTSLMLVFLLSSITFISGSIIGLIGALLGFLFWNWHPSKIFMGDVGSNFLGGVFAWIILNTNEVSNSLVLILIALPLILDPLICLIRRFLAKQNIFEAHSQHLYQRLIKGKLKQRQVAILYISSSSSISLSFFYGGFKTELIVATLNLIVALWLEKNYAAKFEY